jgi:hypothetical protein
MRQRMIVFALYKGLKIIDPKSIIQVTLEISLFSSSDNDLDDLSTLLSILGDLLFLTYFL